MGQKAIDLLKEIENWASKGWAKAILFVGAFFFILLCHFAFCFKIDGFYASYEYGFRNLASLKAAVSLFSIALILVVFASSYLFYKKELTKKRLQNALLLVVFLVVLLLGGFRNFNSNTFTHDFQVFIRGGHWEIIYDIFETGKIPPVDLTNQFYQVKFYHTIGAYFAKFFSFFIPSTPSITITIFEGDTFLSLHDAASLECIRILEAYFGCLNFYFIAKIFGLLFKENETKALLSSVFCFILPSLYFVIYSKNNDLFALTFSLLSLYLALLWREKRSFLRIILLALSIAAAMESKLNSALIAFPVAFIFLLEFLRLYSKKEIIEKKERRTFWLQILCFGILVFPLALFGHVYQMLRYDEPFGYVLDLEANGPNYMHVDNEFYTFFFRFLAFPSPDLFSDVSNIRAYIPVSGGPSLQYVWGKIDYNAWTAFFKTTIWEEHNAYYLIGTSSFDVFLIHAIYVVFLLFALAVFFNLIYKAVSYLYDVKEKRRGAKLSFSTSFLLILGFVQGVAYLYFCYKYQVGCTMNARYALLLYLPFNVLLSDFFIAFFKRKAPQKKLFVKEDSSL